MAGGNQLFFKEYENYEDNIVSNMLNTGAVHSFVNFFNSYMVKKLCDFMLFDDVLFIYDYMMDSPVQFVTLVVTRIDKKVDFETQAKALKKVAQHVSREFYECYNEVMSEMQLQIEAFEPFSERCDALLSKIANELDGTTIHGF